MTRTEKQRKLRIESARVAPVELDGLVCSDCGADGVMTVAPGQDVEWPAENTVFVRALPPRGWCLTCCLRRHWFTEAVEKSIGSTANVCAC